MSTTDTPPSPPETPPPDATRAGLHALQSAVNTGKGWSEAIQSVLEGLKDLPPEKRWSQIIPLGLALLAGKLTADRKKENAAASVPQAATPAHAAPAAGPAAAPAAQAPESQQAKGPLADAIRSIGKGIEVLGSPEKLNTTWSKVSGKSGWTPGDKTDNWDYRSRNNEADMTQGIYQVQQAVPSGFDRNRASNVPAATAQKITAICKALRVDPRLPLHYGIRLKVDGISVIVMKEIHCHAANEPKKVDEKLYHPHTGTAYAVG